MEITVEERIKMLIKEHEELLQSASSQKEIKRLLEVENEIFILRGVK